MHARVVLGVGKGVLFREVSSVQGHPYIEGFHCTIYREQVLYIYTYLHRQPLEISVVC